MLGADSVPHWFRRAISFLNPETQVQYLRGAAGATRARKAAAERRLIARRLAARSSSRGRHRGPRVLEEIVTSWEEQDVRKTLATRKPRMKPGQT